MSWYMSIVVKDGRPTIQGTSGVIPDGTYAVNGHKYAGPGSAQTSFSMSMSMTEDNSASQDAKETKPGE